MQGKLHTCVGAPPPKEPCCHWGGTSVPCSPHQKGTLEPAGGGDQVQQLLDKNPCLEFRWANLDSGCFPLWMQGPAF